MSPDWFRAIALVIYRFAQSARNDKSGYNKTTTARFVTAAVVLLEPGIILCRRSWRFFMRTITVWRLPSPRAASAPTFRARGDAGPRREGVPQNPVQQARQRLSGRGASIGPTGFRGAAVCADEQSRGPLVGAISPGQH